MKVLVSKLKSGLGYQARLVDYGYQAFGKTYDDAVYNLQARMAETLSDENFEWSLFQSPEASEDWESGDDAIYCHNTFVFDGKVLELPKLRVRTNDNAR